jgi:hypothetical protein
VTRLRSWIVLATAVGAIFAASTIEVARSAGAADGAACEDTWRTLLAGKTEQAAERFAELAQLEPLDGCAVEGRVVALIELHRWRDALREAQTFHRRDPEQPRVVAALGEALYRAGKLTEVRELLTLLASGEAPPAVALTLMGLVSVADGKSEEAVGWMDRAVGIAPQDRRVLFRAAEAAGTRAEAADRLERYIGMSEGDDADRIEGARGRLRMLRALGDRPVWVVESRPDHVELPLQLLPLAGGGLLGAVVKARVGEKGKPVRLLLDSGSSGLFLVERMARKRGFEELSVETAFGGGGDKRHVSPRGLFDRFAVGELVFGDALASTTRVEFDGTGRYLGVLGLSIFDGYRVTIDLSRGKLLLDLTDERIEGASYWTVAGQMLVRTGSRDGETSMFLFDTGATTSVLDVDYAERAPGAELHEGASLRGYGGAIGHALVVRGTRLTFQGFDTGDGSLRATDLSLRSHLGGVQLGGFLGLDLLGGRRLVVDTVARTVRVERAN